MISTRIESERYNYPLLSDILLKKEMNKESLASLTTKIEFGPISSSILYLYVYWDSTENEGSEWG